MIVIEDGFTGIDYDLTHPRIGWHREPGTATATNSATGFDAEFADGPLTYKAWKPASPPASWRMTFDAAARPSYIAVTGRDLATAGATLTVEKLTGGTWSDWGGSTTITPTTSDAILFLLDPQEVDGIGIEVTGGTPTIINIRAGDIMEWPRLATYTGTPIPEARQFRYNVNESDTGNWLGRTKVSDGLQFSVGIDHLSEIFRRNEFTDFADHCNTGDATFWIAPRTKSSLPRRNLLDWSEAFDNAVWGKVLGPTVTADAIAAPNGTTTADLLQGGSDAVSAIRQTYADVSVGEVYSFSIYAKQDDTLNSRFLCRQTVGTQFFDVAWSGGVPTATGGLARTITSVGSGWYRFSWECNVQSGSSSIGLEVQPDRDAGTAGVYLWGAQVEESSTLTSYQKTEDGNEFFYLNEVAYAWSPDTVRAERTQAKKTIANSVQLDLRGYLAP